MEKNKTNLNVPHLRFPEFSGEWEKYLLKSIANIYDGTHQTPRYTKSGVPFMSVEDITQKSSSEQKYISEQDFHNDFRNPPQKGDILMTRIGDIGTPCIVSTDEALGYYVSLALIRPHEKLQSSFLNYVIQSDSFKRELYKRTIHVAFPQKINKEDIGKCKLDVPSIEEQSRIGNLLSLIDERISTQRKIIEDLKKIKDAITHSHYRNEVSHSPMVYIGQYITQVSKRNKDAKIDRVLSVSNKYGFINQDEQFEDREVASADTSNYKVVHKGDFAYNPARINVGSVARLQEFENGIVSPMYVCFTAKKGLLPAYFELYLSTGIFKHEMNKRLEGSVRLCLTYESLCNIKIALPEFNVQKDFVLKVSTILTKIRAEERLLYMYHNCKQYFLSQMFI